MRRVLISEEQEYTGYESTSVAEAAMLHANKGPGDSEDDIYNDESCHKSC